MILNTLDLEFLWYNHTVISLFLVLYMTSVAVIGAGIAGLTAARELAGACHVCVFDKSRGVGGRLASRRAPGHVFDHGAPFFLANSPLFCQWLKPAIEAQALLPWHGRFGEFSGRHLLSSRLWDDRFPHYVGAPSMNHFAKFLCRGLTIERETHVAHLAFFNEKWTLYDSKMTSLGSFDWVVVALPPAQAAKLLSPHPDILPLVPQASLSPCFSLMLGFTERPAWPFDAGVIKNSPLSWIALHGNKPGRSDYGGVALSSNEWAKTHLNDDLDATKNILLSAALTILDTNKTQLSHVALHRWRFANLKKQGGPLHQVHPVSKIALCGDGFIQGRVEAAFLSAFTMAQQLIQHLR